MSSPDCSNSVSSGQWQLYLSTEILDILGVVPSLPHLPSLEIPFRIAENLKCRASHPSDKNPVLLKIFQLA